MSFTRSIVLATLLAATLIFRPSLALAYGAPDYRPDRPHPRLYLTPEKLKELRAKAKTSEPAYVRWKNWVDANRQSATVMDLALMFQITRTVSDRDRAVAALTALVDNAPELEAMQSSYDFMDNWESYAPQYIWQIAIGYDWLYAQLSSHARKKCRALLTKVADRIVSFNDNDDWTPYANYLLRGMWAEGLVGITIYGDDSTITPKAEKYLTAARRIYFDKLLPTMQRKGPGNAWYGGGAPEGTGYGGLDLGKITEYALFLRQATGRDIIGDNRFFKDALLYLMHSIYPTNYKGKQFMSGDFKVDLYSGGRRQDGLDDKSDVRQTMLQLIEAIGYGTDTAKRASSYLRDPSLGLDAVRYDNEAIIDVLYPKANQALLPHTKLIPFYYAAGTGTVFMRSDWSADATWAAFQAGDKFAYHQHNEQGSFQIAKYGQLAVKSGNYSYGSPRSPAVLNYVIRTVASNALLIYDPHETFSQIRADDHYTNDGGQRGYAPYSAEPHDLDYWRDHATTYATAHMLAVANTPQYTWSRADLTNAYSSKVTKYWRDFLFLRQPGKEEFFVVFDRVRSSKPGFFKRWVLHTQDEPVIRGMSDGPAPVAYGRYWSKTRQVTGHVATTAGDIVMADDLSGRLFCQTLLPEQHTITKIGGKGYEAYSDGIRYKIPSTVYPMGSWRIEVEPRIPSRIDYFLHVLFPTRNTVKQMPKTTLLRAMGNTRRRVMVGAQIEGGTNVYVVLYRQSVSGDPIPSSVTLTYSITAVRDSIHYIFDLTPGTRYRLTVAKLNKRQSIRLWPDTKGNIVVNAQGAITFRVPAIRFAVSDKQFTYAGKRYPDLGRHVAMVSPRTNFSAARPKATLLNKK